MAAAASISAADIDDRRIEFKRMTMYNLDVPAHEDSSRFEARRVQPVMPPFDLFERLRTSYQRLRKAPNLVMGAFSFTPWDQRFFNGFLQATDAEVKRYTSILADSFREQPEIKDRIRVPLKMERSGWPFFNVAFDTKTQESVRKDAVAAYERILEERRIERFNQLKKLANPGDVSRLDSSTTSAVSQRADAFGLVPEEKIYVYKGFDLHYFDDPSVVCSDATIVLHHMLSQIKDADQKKKARVYGFVVIPSYRVEPDFSLAKEAGWRIVIKKHQFDVYLTRDMLEELFSPPGLAVQPKLIFIDQGPQTDDMSVIYASIIQTLHENSMTPFSNEIQMRAAPQNVEYLTVTLLYMAPDCMYVDTAVLNVVSSIETYCKKGEKTIRLEEMIQYCRSKVPDRFERLKSCISAVFSETYVMNRNMAHAQRYVSGYFVMDHDTKKYASIMELRELLDIDPPEAESIQKARMERKRPWRMW